MRDIKYFFSVIFVIFFLQSNLSAQNISPKIKDNLFSKDSVTIVILDSGLGGLSIAADLHERLKQNGIFKRCSIVFFNAQPHINYGYNQMKSTEEKVWVFNNALNAINTTFKPDVILIGCNTLSVIYEYTDFYKKSMKPVMGIIDAGVELIKTSFDKHNNFKVVIFATETTVSEAKHKTNLIRMGMDEKNIISVACPKLAGSIERDSESKFTDSLVTAYVNEAIKKIGKNKSDIIVSYNCTHYGYIDNLFRKKFSDAGIMVKEYIDPNPYMLNMFLKGSNNHRFSKTESKIYIVSQAELTPDKIGSIYSLIEKSSPDAAEALFNYQFQSEFFNWKFDMVNKK